MPQFDRGVRSTAAIAGHPLHPMLVPLPIGLLVGALAGDLAFRGTGDAFWARASLWLIAAGLVTGAIAAIADLIDFLTIERVRRLAAGWVHFLGNAAALLLSLWNLLHRLDDPAGAVMPGGILLSLAVVAIFLVTGWLGGELAFRYKVGIIEAEAAALPAHGTAGLDPSYAGSRGPVLPEIARDPLIPP
jgi:uncharacterized membrane protein